MLRQQPRCEVEDALFILLELAEAHVQVGEVGDAHGGRYRRTEPAVTGRDVPKGSRDGFGVRTVARLVVEPWSACSVSRTCGARGVTASDQARGCTVVFQRSRSKQTAMIRRIVLPLDGSRFAEHAIPLAVSIATRTNALLEFAGVSKPPFSSQYISGVRRLFST